MTPGGQSRKKYVKQIQLARLRYQKMVEWMDNVEMAIQKVCASKVYTSAEFKREKDNFHVGTWVKIIQIKLMKFAVAMQKSGEGRDQEMADGDSWDIDEGLTTAKL